MLKPRVFLRLLALAFLIVFVAGLLRLFHLRFERGDVFPPYSSLRTDPLGTKALHDSLSELPGVKVSRNYKPVEKLAKPGLGTSVLFLGVPRFEQISDSDWQELLRLAMRGHRVVLTLRSQAKAPHSSATPTPADSPAGKATDDEATKKEEAQGASVENEEPELTRVAVTYLEPSKNLTAVSAAPELPAEVNWHSIVAFIPEDDGWRYIYRVHELPVLMERPYGKGSLVLASDTWFLSNEALRDDRHPSLIAWVTGQHQRVIFDEFHNGLSESEGVMKLIKKYQLRPLAFALAILAALFVWKSSMPLVPVLKRSTGPGTPDGTVQGKDSAAGFVNLLHRSIRPADLIPVCFQEWRQAGGPGRKDFQNRIQAAEDVVRDLTNQSARRRDPVSAYQRIARILKGSQPDNKDL